MAVVSDSSLLYVLVCWQLFPEAINPVKLQITCLYFVYKCYNWGLNMKEKIQTPSDMISRNWVLKRKRKKLLCAPDVPVGRHKDDDLTSESAGHPSSSNDLQNAERKFDHLTSKRKGNDGYYYECVVCDLGGNLLCCESCPKTYHIECLDPPLKRIPNGKWECPSCEQIDNFLDPVNHEELPVKRARTKNVIENLTSGGKMSGALRVSQFLGSSIGKKRSSSKRKSGLSVRASSLTKTESSQNDVSCHRKFRQLSRDGSVDVSNSHTNPRETGKISDSSISDRRSNCLVGHALSCPSNTNLVPNSETAKEKPDPSNKFQSDGKDSVPTLGVSTEAHKRKHKSSKDGNKKKYRMSIGESAAKSAHRNKGKAHDPSLKINKPQRKRSSVHQKGFVSPENAVSGSTESQPQEEQAHSKVAVQTSRALSKSERGADKIVLSEDISADELLQVDRVLGCRVEEYRINSPCKISEVMTTGVPTADHHIHDNQTGQDVYKSGSSCGLLVNGPEDPSMVQNVERISDRLQCAENDGEMDKTQTCKSMAKEDSEEDLQGEVGKCAGNDVLIGNDKVKSNFQTGDLTASPVIEDETKGQKLLANDGSCDNKLVPALAESAFGDGGDIKYEFLVKWAGRSHIHNSWIPESKLKVLAKRKLDNYKAKYGNAAINLCEDRWKQPQRVIAVQSSTDATTEAFIKWSGLPYDECTWEKINEPAILKYLHLIDQFNRFEHVALEKDADRHNLPERGDFQQNEILPLTEQPGELEGGSLFPHQLEALNWLRKCWYKSKNVILADEMGLGKTVSACAFISCLYCEFKAKLPCLVLVPLSTMPNWMAEFASWAPHLNVVEYHGNVKGRTVIRQYEWHASVPNESNKKSAAYKFNVLLTTYEMVLADSSHLRAIPWEVLIVDEGHRLKNSSSKLFSLLNTFLFQHRVLLTGTPLQNNLGELYNLLNFLQPASFPSLSLFEEKFKDLSSAEKVEELKKLVAPHMLRRLKKDAMQNIPPKTEKMVPVELSPIQAEYYRAMLTKNYQILRNVGKGVPHQSMLNIVMQLRKVCNHPYLIPGTEPDSGSVEFLQEMRIKASAKLTLLHSMLKLLHTEGHRVLIFSQMTKLLDILEDYLTVEFGSKSFERVDGSVSVADRQAAIARFNQDKSRFVFLLSTRSCGLGINLATADTVIIYDSDFNPHADIQAMNRAHRIGQSNRLLVYRLVVRASVEERILQLAKKKLMLDQLFVNKSESQKEVEDILRWGTEELFSDSCNKEIGENNTSKDETVPDIEQKSKRRLGGLGDVYQDKCTEGSCKITWDENAILKLLDRSNLHSGSPDNSEGDVENDMLGSVKSVEWTEEPMDEGKTESPLVVTDDASATNLEKKEEASGTDENEWDKLLRVRWEKYQNEEEASLGRGKRLRKAVSYREAFAQHPNETLSESGGEDDPGPEPEPERAYTPAGRAFKEKFTRLRARQKGRLAQRKAFEEFSLAGGLPGPEALSQGLPSHLKERDETTKLMQPSAEKAKMIEVEDNKLGELEVPGSNSGSVQVARRLLKHRYNNQGNFTLKVPGSSSDGQNVNSNLANSVDQNPLLPVLGLCAPNACQPELSHRSLSKSHGRENRQGNRWDFPVRLSTVSGTSAEKDVNALEAGTGTLELPAASLEFPQQHFKSSFRDNPLPFPLCPLPLWQRKFSDGIECSVLSSADFLEKMGLPTLPFDEKLHPAFPPPMRTLHGAVPDFLANSSMGKRGETANGQLSSTIPFLPNFKFPQHDMPHHNQEDVDPLATLSLGRKSSTHPSFPENHRKILENIAMRTGSGSSNLFRRKSKADDWSEDELDSLWIGVRRHGRGNWDVMLRDPRLTFSKYKTPQELASRWEEEQMKILDLSPATRFGKQPKTQKATLFPGISDGMMARALHGSRLGGPFQTHLTDMKLGFCDLAATIRPFEPLNFAVFHNENHTPFPLLGGGNLPSRRDDPSRALSEIEDTTSNLPTEQPVHPDALGTNDLRSLGINCSSSYDQRRVDGSDISRYSKLLCDLDRSLDIPSVPVDYAVTSEPPASNLLPGLNSGPSISCLKGKELVSERSCSRDKLPHWLRKAVGASSKAPNTELPPTVSAIAESVRLLYAQEKPAIPPFLAPGPPPPQPRDPRKILKKKKKIRPCKPVMAQNEIAGSSQEVCLSSSADSLPSTSISVPLHLRRPGSQPSNTGLIHPSTSSYFSEPLGKVSAELSLSPALPDDKRPQLLELDQEGDKVVRVTSQHESGVEGFCSGDSTKTQSDPVHVDPPEAEEISSEKNVSAYQTG